MTLLVSLSVRNGVKYDPAEGTAVCHPFMWGLGELIIVAKRKIHLIEFLMVKYDYDQSFKDDQIKHIF